MWHECHWGRVVRRSERLHALTESLRRSGNRGRTAEQLAAEFEVSVRTIKRDLASLEASGLPLWSRPGPGGGYGLLSGGALPAHRKRGCRWFLKPPVSSSDRAM